MYTISDIKSYVSDFEKSYEFWNHGDKKSDEVARKIMVPEKDTFEIIENSATGKKHLVPAQGQYILLYRGQSEEFIPCLPSLYRPSSAEPLSLLRIFVDRMRVYEFELMLKSHIAVIDGFEKYGYNVDYEGLAQHYGLRTEIMDFTSDIDIALFFAMCPYDSASDSYVLPPKSGSHKAIVYVLSPFMYEPNFATNKYRSIFAADIQPIGLQPFERPAIQKGYGVRLAEGKALNHVWKYEFSFTDSEAKEYHARFADKARLWTKDELIVPTQKLAKQTVLNPKIFTHVWKSHPINGVTRSQWMKLLKKNGINIDSKAPIASFAEQNQDPQFFEFCAKRLEKYRSRLVQKKVYQFGPEQTFKEVSPYMTTELLANSALLGVGLTGKTGPDGVQGCTPSADLDLRTLPIA